MLPMVNTFIQQDNGTSSAIKRGTGTPQCALGSVVERFDCHPEPNGTEEACSSRGCCWNDLERDGQKPPDIPRCYFPSDYMGYSVDSVTTRNDGFDVKLTRQTPSGIDEDVRSVNVAAIYYDQDTVRITVTDAARQRYVPPVPVIETKTFTGNRTYNVEISQAGVISVQRLDEQGTTLFRANLSQLVFTDYFLQLSTMMPTDFVYGLGERWGPLRRSVNWTHYYFFAKGGWPGFNHNLYGAHPFYIAVEDGGSSHGVFLHNSNYVDILLQPTPAATFRALGGVLDFFVFAGPTPLSVIRQYQRVVGFPAMPPYWGLGFHLCRYGYGSLKRTREVMENNIKAGIPLEVQWNDIDYMDRQNDFTYDKEAYADLPDFVAKVHEGGRHYVMIFDPGVSGHEEPGTYPPLDDGLEMDVFIRNVTGGVVHAKVWNPVSTVFPDFTHPNSTEYWKKQFRDFYAVVPFDGAWIDMNEPYAFGGGANCPRDQRVERPPYVPGGEPLATETLCMSDKHYISPHYDVHNVYSQLEAKATYQALVEIRQKRPFIISRATSPGQGAWTGHWSGDIESSWGDMRLSIPNMLSFGMYGIPLSGADICGFRENTTVELCARWHALGAFYPFSRNHNDVNTTDQDPYSMGDVVVEVARETLAIRYAMLPHLYTLFYRSHVYGDTVATALFIEFPDDPNTYEIDEQFMWGSALLFSPALYEGQTEVKAYVPKGTWYDLITGRRYDQRQGGYKLFTAPMGDKNILIRGGHILPLQRPADTIKASRKNPISLLVAPNELMTAYGMLYWDDGESLDAVQNEIYDIHQFILSKNVLSLGQAKNRSAETLTLGGVTVYGISERPHAVRIVGGRQLDFVYSEAREVLSIVGVNQPMVEVISIFWS